jgi:hypothetical protein
MKLYKLNKIKPKFYTLSFQLPQPNNPCGDFGVNRSVNIDENDSIQLKDQQKSVKSTIVPPQISPDTENRYQLCINNLIEFVEKCRLPIKPLNISLLSTDLQFMAFSMCYSIAYILFNVNAFRNYYGDQWSSNCNLQEIVRDENTDQKENK